MFQSLIGRLQTTSVSTPAPISPMFQSLIGRLQTWYSEHRCCFDFKFQSLIGRLQTAEKSVYVSKEVRVSIPHR